MVAGLGVPVFRVFTVVCGLTVISSLVPRKTLKTLAFGLGLKAFLVLLVLAVLCAKGLKMIM